MKFFVVLFSDIALLILCFHRILSIMPLCFTISSNDLLREVRTVYLRVIIRNIKIMDIDGATKRRIDCPSRSDELRAIFYI